MHVFGCASAEEEASRGAARSPGSRDPRPTRRRSVTALQAIAGAASAFPASPAAAHGRRAARPWQRILTRGFSIAASCRSPERSASASSESRAPTCCAPPGLHHHAPRGHRDGRRVRDRVGRQRLGRGRAAGAGARVHREGAHARHQLRQRVRLQLALLPAVRARLPRSRRTASASRARGTAGRSARDAMGVLRHDASLSGVFLRPDTLDQFLTRGRGRGGRPSRPTRRTCRCGAERRRRRSGANGPGVEDRRRLAAVGRQLRRARRRLGWTRPSEGNYALRVGAAVRARAIEARAEGCDGVDACNRPLFRHIGRERHRTSSAGAAARRARRARGGRPVVCRAARATSTRRPSIWLFLGGHAAPPSPPTARATHLAFRRRAARLGPRAPTTSRRAT